MSQTNVIELDIPRILELLAHGTMEVEGLLPYSSNYTLLVSLTYQGLQALAVYKPRRGERPLWDFPRGTLYQREFAAYLVSEALDFDLIPPTVIRNGDFGVGVVQLYIENDPEAHLLTMQREGCYDDVLLQLAAFDHLVNNADRKSGHCLKGVDGRLWSIDHGICFHEEEKLRTVLWDFIGQPFPNPVIEAFQRFQQCLCKEEKVAQLLGELLSIAEMRALERRLAALMASGRYPAPGDGPHIPWPPV